MFYWGLNVLAGDPECHCSTITNCICCSSPLNVLSWVWETTPLAQRPEVTEDQEKGQVLITSGRWDTHILPHPPPLNCQLPQPIRRLVTGHFEAISTDKKSINPAGLRSPANAHSEHVSSETTCCDSRWVYQHESDLRRDSELYWVLAQALNDIRQQTVTANQVCIQCLREGKASSDGSKEPWLTRSKNLFSIFKDAAWRKIS